LHLRRWLDTLGKHDIEGFVTMKIDDTMVRKIGHLARLEIKEADVHSYAQSLTQILTWVEQLGEVDTSAIEPQLSVHVPQMPERPDQITDGGYANAILSNAPDKNLNMFAVPKVVE
jgi:aspartyl-tRNA(Asn)/glutamyl-tRNA(Gln) amidotransferase subunit C